MKTDTSTEKRYMLDQARLSKKTFDQFSQYIHQHYGIKLPPAKQVMLECRLRKRLRELSMSSFEDYAAFVFDEGNSDEMVNLADVVSTNKTDFFREPHHFELLKGRIIPAWIKRRETNSRRPLRVWSAACSTGEEPYTLAMVLNAFAEKHAKFDYTILGTDLSKQVLQHAHRAIYAESRVEPIPMALRKKYLLRSKNRRDKRVRISPALRAKVQFKRLNFLQDNYPSAHLMDIIFCRNVFIYFDRETQMNITLKLCSCLKPGGLLFIGHSESLNGMDLPLKLVESTVYEKI